MNDLFFYLGENKIDITDEKSIQVLLSFGVNDVFSPNERTSGRSKTITVPATNIVKLAFGFQEDINSEDSFDQSQRPTARIEYGGTVLMYGFAKPTGSVQDYSGKVTAYHVVLYGDNGDPLLRLGKDMLSDLDYSDQNHYYTFSEQIASELYPILNPSKEYVYDLIDRGATSGTLNGNPTVRVEDRYPAIKGVGVIKRILKRIGYTLRSSFLEGSFCDRLYIPFCNQIFKQPNTWNQNQTFYAERTFGGTQVTKLANETDHHGTVSFDNDSVAPGFDTNNNFTVATSYLQQFAQTGSFYRCPSAGNYKIKVHLNYSTSGSVAPTGLVFFNIMRKNSYYGDGPTVVYQDSILWVPGVSSSITLDPAGYLQLKAFDELFVEIYLTLGSTATDCWITIFSGSYFQCSELNGVFPVTRNQYVDMNQNLPENISQYDYIMGWKDLFCLQFWSNPVTREFFIEPWDDFYKDRYIDYWKVDLNVPVRMSFLGEEMMKRVRYRYSTDGNDKWATKYERENNKPLASHEEINNNAFASEGTSDVTVKEFCPTAMEVPYFFYNNSNLPVSSRVPRMWSNESMPNKSTKFGLRLLYYAGIVSMQPGETWVHDDAGITTQQRLDYPYFFSVDETSKNDNSLYFNDTAFSHGLYAKYWRNYHRIIQSSRLVTLNLWLNDVDIANLDFRIPIYLEIEGNGAYYILHKVIDYDPSERTSTRVELLKMVGNAPMTELTLTPHPVITWTGVDAPRETAPSTDVGRLSNGDTVIYSQGQIVARITSGGDILPGKSGGYVYAEINGITTQVTFVNENGNIQNLVK